MPRHSSQILELAKRGAEARIKELQAEIADLGKIASGRALVVGKVAPTASTAPSFASPGSTGTRKRRRKMSAAARKKISEAQKARWAKRRASKKA